MKYNTIFLALVLSLSISSPIELNANSYFKNGVDMLYSSFKNLSQYMPNILRTLTPENLTLFTVTIGTLGAFAYQSYQSYRLKKILNDIQLNDYMHNYQNLNNEGISEQIKQINNNKTTSPDTKAIELKALHNILKERYKIKQ